MLWVNSCKKGEESVNSLVLMKEAIERHQISEILSSTNFLSEIKENMNVCLLYLKGKGNTTLASPSTVRPSFY